MSTYESIISMKNLLLERPFEVLSLAFEGNRVALATLSPNGVYAVRIRSGVPYGEFPIPGTAKAIQAYEEGTTSFEVWTETETVSTLTVDPIGGEFIPSGPESKFLLEWLLKAIE